MQITIGKIKKPFRVLIYGGSGIGKSTLASKAPDPLFLDCEHDGTSQIDCSRASINSWGDLGRAVMWLQNEEHVYKSVVIDTIDALEMYLFAQLCQERGWKSIEDKGYGAGYEEARQRWERLLNALEGLVDKGMNIIFVSHEQVRAYKNPETEPYDRYTLKVNQKAAELIIGRMDAVLFCHKEINVIKADKTKNVRGIQGDRVIETCESAAWRAKNRYDLPEQCEMDATIWNLIQK
jgi:hypothetical protein